MAHAPFNLLLEESERGREHNVNSRAQVACYTNKFEGQTRVGIHISTGGRFIYAYLEQEEVSSFLPYILAGADPESRDEVLTTYFASLEDEEALALLQKFFNQREKARFDG